MKPAEPFWRPSTPARCESRVGVWLWRTRRSVKDRIGEAAIDVRASAVTSANDGRLSEMARIGAPESAEPTRGATRRSAQRPDESINQFIELARLLKIADVPGA